MHAVTSGDVDSDDVEPPVPPSLADLPAPLQSLATFLHVDDDLLAVAAQASPPLNTGSPTGPDNGHGRRTVARLRADADHRRAERERLAAERSARERAARERAAVLARTRHLEALARDGESAWKRVDALIRDTYPNRPALLQRLDRAELTADPAD